MYVIHLGWSWLVNNAHLICSTVKYQVWEGQLAELVRQTVDKSKNNKLAKLGDAIAISKSETIND